MKEKKQIEAAPAIEDRGELGRKVLQKNFANIIRKAQAGKTLTAQELAIIEDSSKEAQNVRWIKTRTELAVLCGVARGTFDRIIARDDAPKKTKRGWNLEAARSYILQNLKSETKIAQSNPKMADAKLEEVEIKLRRARREEQIELGDLIRLSDLKQEIGLVVEKIKVGLMALPTQWGARVGAIGPEIEQMTKADITEALRTLADDLCGVVK